MQPKYWCKHCKTFVRDTKLEKANHDATPKHQGNLKRFLRDLHRGHEKDEKDKERAKAEVARLNGLTAGGASGAGSSSSSSFGQGPTPSLPKPQATASQRKQQLAQLAEMGVSIPDEFRPDMAMAGEWQVTSERIVEVDEGEKKPEAKALGVRKRASDEGEAEEIEAKKRRWGSTYRTHPDQEDDGDLDALLSNATRKSEGPVVKEEVKEEVKQEGEDIKTEPGTDGIYLPTSLSLMNATKEPGIKREISDGESVLPAAIEGDLQGEDQSAAKVIFKKRKAKNIRQK